MAWVGRQLCDQRFRRVLAAGLDDTCRHLGVVAERDAALFDVGAGDVDLDRIYGRIVEALRDVFIFLDSGTRHVGDEACLREVEPRQNLLDDTVDAWILQADGIEHAVRSLVDAVRRVAEPHLPGRSLETYGADVGVRETHDARVLLAEADAA